MKANVIIIDDEPLARGLIKEYMSHFPELTLIAECGDGFEGIKSIQNLNPDLVFLDVRMPKLNGFEMLELLENTPSVIFTTAFDEYAMKAFDTNALDYLLKPFSQERFNKAVLKFLNNESSKNLIKALQEGKIEPTPSHENRIVVKSGQDIIIVPVKDIDYIESYDDYVKIHSSGKIYVKKKTMSYYESTLDKGHFIRIHRSYLVNIEKAKGLISVNGDNYNLELLDGTVLSVSRSGYSRLKEVIKN